MTAANRGRRARRGLIAAGAVLALGAGGVIVVNQTTRAGASDPEPTRAAVTTEQVATRTLADAKLASCTLDHGNTTSLAAPIEGTVTWLPAPGATIKPGAPLYAIDGRAALLLRGKTPAWRDLAPGIENGADIAQLKRALADLGRYELRAGERAEAWTWRLTEAIRTLQRSAGLERTGSLPLGAVVFLPGPVRVAEVSAPLGQRVTAATPLLSYSGTRRQLTCQVPAADRRFVAKGAAASVSFADGTTATGKVAAATPATRPESGGEQNEDPGLSVQVRVPQDKLGQQPDGASAQATFRTVLAKDALAVPVTALVALTTGGYAVQVQRPSGALEYVPVTPGVYAGTWVQVTDGDLQVGDKVVVTP